MANCTNQLSATIPLLGCRTAATFQIFNLSFCAVQATPVIWTQIATSLQITQGGAMCILAIIQFVRQSLQMYRATKLLQFNRYMSLLARQGILYFFVYVLVPWSSLPSKQSLPNELMVTFCTASFCLPYSMCWVSQEGFRQEDGSW